MDLYCVDEIQWDPVNTDTKGTCHSVCIIWVSVLNGLSGTHVLSIERPKQTVLRENVV